MNYLSTSLFTFDYKFDESKGGKFKKDGSINADAIVPGEFEVQPLAATGLEDVTSTVDAKWGYTADQKEEGGYAWKFSLRHDLVWDDGTKIKAQDFIYTMKQQLDPDFQNMRASSYYINMQVKNAKNYLYNGTSGWYAATDAYSLSDYSTDLDDKLIFSLGNSAENTDFGGKTCYVRTALGAPASYTGAQMAAFLEDYSGAPAADIMALEGKTLATIKADPALKATWDSVIGWWQTDPGEELHFMVTNYTFPEMNFEDVGYYAVDDYSFVVCLDTSVHALKEDGSLSYHAAYEFQSFPLVKQDLYERCKQAPQEGSTLWTSNYGTSQETTASWGPYKLTQFQGGKSYTLSRNDEWFAYDLDEYADQYNVTSITCECLSDVNSQWMAFNKGDIDEIGLDPKHKDDYRNSKYTYYSPDTGTFGIQIYSNLDVLKDNGRNNGILAVKDFREAIALYLDRDDYNTKCFTSHQSCYGLLGPSYYYDVENGGVYRYTKQAKEGLLRTYGFEFKDGKWTDGTTVYDDYEDAYAAMNGMNRGLAKEKLEAAYTEVTTHAADYNYDDSKPITIVFGTSEDNENTRRHYNYFTEFFADLTKDTSLEGKINFTFDASSGAKWADEFKAGSYEFAVCTGFTGGAFDPAGTLQCYLDPNAGLMYPVWWDPTTDPITYTMPAGTYKGAGETITMSAYEWYACLNGLADGRYNWGSGAVDEDVRLTVLSMLEEFVLKKYYTIITTSEYSATVKGAKFSYITDEFNFFMGYGGFRYLRANYTDKGWADYANSTSLETEYKKTN